MTRAHLGLCAALALSACSGSKDKAPDPTDTGPECGTEVFFEDANNYSFTASFHIGEVAVAPKTPLTIDWSGVTVDIRGRPVDPAAIEQLLFVELDLTQSEVLDKIDANALDQSDAGSQLLWDNDGETSMSSDEFTQIGNPIDYDALDDDPSQSWLLSVINYQIDGRFDFLMNTFVVPTTGSTNTEVVLDNSTSTLDFEVDLHSADRLCFAPDEPELVLDWVNVTTDAYDRPLDLAYVNNLVIGHIPDGDIENVEGIFLRLYDEADQLYDLNVNGLSFAYLDEAVSREDGTTPFPGFSDDGTWVVAIECTRSECTNPAPVLLGVVEVK